MFNTLQLRLLSNIVPGVALSNCKACAWPDPLIRGQCGKSPMDVRTSAWKAFLVLIENHCIGIYCWHCLRTKQRAVFRTLGSDQ